jgi:hypothetical protein
LVLVLSVFHFRKSVILFPQKKYTLIFLSIFLLTAIQALLNGSYLTEERWINRYIILLTFFVFLQFFQTQDSIGKIKWPFCVFIFSVSAYSFYQYVFIFEPGTKLALSTFSSRFWNINMYSQAMVVALPLLSFFRGRSVQKKFRLWIDLSLILIFTTLLASQSRTSMIGLGLFFTIELFRPNGFSRKTLLALFLFSCLIFSGLHTYKSQLPKAGTGITDKTQSFSYRRNVYEKSIEMAKDFPTGVGTNRFPYYLFIYFNQNKVSADYDDVYKTPHSEPLEVLTENGLGIFIVYSIFIIFVLLKSIQLVFFRKSASLFARFYICAFPEILFHFPSDMYFPVMLCAVLLGPELSQVSQLIKNKLAIKIALVLSSLLLLSTYAAREFYIVPQKWAKPYCHVFHDNFEMCRRYFATAYVENDFNLANDLIRPTLKYQPFNFYALALDYSLASEPRSQIAACLYYNLFNGEHQIKNSPVDKCHLVEDKNKKIEAFLEYSDRR